MAREVPRSSNSDRANVGKSHPHATMHDRGTPKGALGTWEAGRAQPRLRHVIEEPRPLVASGTWRAEGVETSSLQGLPSARSHQCLTDTSAGPTHGSSHAWPFSRSSNEQSPPAGVARAVENICRPGSHNGRGCSQLRPHFPPHSSESTAPVGPCPTQAEPCVADPSLGCPPRCERLPQAHGTVREDSSHTKHVADAITHAGHPLTNGHWMHKAPKADPSSKCVGTVPHACHPLLNGYTAGCLLLGRTLPGFLAGAARRQCSPPHGEAHWLHFLAPAAGPKGTGCMHAVHARAHWPARSLSLSLSLHNSAPPARPNDRHAWHATTGQRPPVRARLGPRTKHNQP
jgi:hypothetical protein